MKISLRLKSAAEKKSKAEPQEKKPLVKTQPKIFQELADAKQHELKTTAPPATEPGPDPDVDARLAADFAAMIHGRINGVECWFRPGVPAWQLEVGGWQWWGPGKPKERQYA